MPGTERPATPAASGPAPNGPLPPSSPPFPADAGGIRPWIPNALTLLRLVIAVGFFAVLTPWGRAVAPDGGPRVRTIQLEHVYLAIAGGLFIVAAITDALDGYLARRWRVVTAFGRVMDPFADKVLVIGAFMYLASPAFQIELVNGVPLQTTGVQPWMVVAILARELLVTSIRAVIESEGIQFPAGVSGKLKMILQSVAVPTVLLTMAVFDAVTPGTFGRWLIDLTVWATVAVTILSGAPYVSRAIVAMRPPRAVADGRGEA